MKIHAIASALSLLSVVHGASPEDAAVPAAPAKSLRLASHIAPAAEPSDDEDAEGDAEARWAQMVAVAVERTTSQCKADCKQKKKDDSDFNKARCERDCDDMNDKGNNSDTRNMSCSDCRATYRKDSNKYDRCMSACGNAQKNCVDADSCSGCNKKCSGNALDKCRDKYCNGNNENDAVADSSEGSGGDSETDPSGKSEAADEVVAASVVRFDNESEDEDFWDCDWECMKCRGSCHLSDECIGEGIWNGGHDCRVKCRCKHGCVKDDDVCRWPSTAAPSPSAVV